MANNSSNDKKYDFSGKVALVTGSSSGIGAAIAIQFARYGAQLTITGRDAVSLAEVAKKIEKEYGGTHKPLKIVGNLLEKYVPTRLVTETIKKYGRLDFLINNAGGGTKFEGVSNENVMKGYEKVFGLNVRVPIKLIHLSAPYLEKTNGTIINISSVASIKPFTVIYCSSKAALDMVTKTTAAELGPKGIRVNSINPGPVITKFARSLGLDANTFEIRKDEMKKYTVMNFVPYPEEIANLASFLVSDDAKNITGSIIVSDCGELVKANK